MTGITEHIVDFPPAFFQIKLPVHLNHNISKDLSDFCMSLILNYEQFVRYINKIKQLNVTWQQ
ncbi:MAG: hypothetical protein EBR91_09905 [Flavobacteriia bacterium]|nr:hypothetical protein [Flavobacteriia bacterium]